MIILILGIMIGAAISSVVSILQFFSVESLLKSFVIWTMGSLGHISKLQLGILAPCIFCGLLLAVFSIKRLDALMLGEKYAVTMGMNIKTTQAVSIYQYQYISRQHSGILWPNCIYWNCCASFMQNFI